jgi:hypothetical protein
MSWYLVLSVFTQSNALKNKGLPSAALLPKTLANVQEPLVS